MQPSRRDFLDKLATGAVALGGLALLGDVAHAASPLPMSAAPNDWDLTWTGRMTGRMRTVFDAPEHESGLAVWRASIWQGQAEAVLGIPTAQQSTALVLRHHAIGLAMTQAFWDRYALAKFFMPMKPLSEEATTFNPALMEVAQGVPEPYASFSLPNFQKRGGIVLACDLALQVYIVPLVMAKDGGTAEEAHARARAGLVAGVIAQPSGTFAATYAQQAAHAHYVRAS